ncbi:rhodanese-like domain-containing protein [Acidomonas methanolica]|uniref:Rhodanese n=1 Tax=Acidomonas methanolica NBRC 104435 TaxID=1231351 RepID=A0A023D6I6_ACIMT|nr:rhodanese-like domain-containing protein [Acidomonas methanolica]MBU2655441.1 PQQ-dependent catabolism-associated CXXCW motif protein [Acidomonas methanolica]TCS23324.1 PQQ-dependent catabolism-associated CXXCW motif protein [Acidomonas methanolica]GAJ29689.1 rhodanese [Acidomonas methanolica NBRC 104435]GBQ52698.1 rhodanese-related sulfurtransferase [Acidomonas methanolica]GEL00267.1 rhodanese domain-containing protein [Acidomonas methanolica NBRC 104435]
MPRAGGVVLAAFLSACFPGALAARAVPEPEGIWTGDIHGAPPATLHGAKLIDTEGLARLLPEKPLLIDSSSADHKPDSLPPGSLWMPVHRSIPGAIWFPDAGYGDLPPQAVADFLKRVKALSGGRTSTPIVSFCHPHCWQSWNVGKRLVEAGYTDVYWYSDGIDGWRKQFPVANVLPQEGWPYRR